MLPSVVPQCWPRSCLQSPILHHVVLRGLLPGQRYFYRVGKSARRNIPASLARKDRVA